MPEVDGIRLIAISMVVLFHINSWVITQYQLPKRSLYLPSNESSSNQALLAQDITQYALWHSFSLHGDRGVMLFFVLSGFIVALPFARHHLAAGPKVLLTNYYTRRFWRIWPPYFVALVSIFCLQMVLHINPYHLSFVAQVRHFLASLFYGHILLYRHLPIVTTVAWSLEIEVQFYLIAPLLFLAFKLSASIRRFLLVALLVSITYVNTHYIIPPLRISVFLFLPLFITGTLLADFYVNHAGKRLLNNWWPSVALPIALCGICSLPYKTQFLPGLLFPVAVGGFIYICLLCPPVRRMLSNPILATVGGMCYSIYLCHLPVISALGRITKGICFPNYLPTLLVHISLFTIAILVVSVVFFLLVERPFMKRIKLFGHRG
jgi:peptidoglycan/LPS O-acetylase OafA/YrhL